jgi:four helix bundle protein
LKVVAWNLEVWKGSAGELSSKKYIGIKIGYLPPDKGRYRIKEVTEISKMLYGLMQSIKNKIE